MKIFHHQQLLLGVVLVITSLSILSTRSVIADESSGNLPDMSGRSYRGFIASDGAANADAQNNTTNQTGDMRLLSNGAHGAGLSWYSEVKVPVAQTLVADNMADPKIVKADGSYFLIATGGNVPYYTSKDNITYHKGGLLLPTLPSYAGQSPMVWSPFIRHNGDKYVMYLQLDTTAYSGTDSVNELYSIGTATSNSPIGPYLPSNTLLLTGGHGIKTSYIDPYFYHDDQSNYLVTATNFSMGNDIWITPLSADGLTTTGVSTRLLNHLTVQNPFKDGTVDRVESPALTRAPDGTYVLIYSANLAMGSSYFTGYAISNSLMGPYTNQGPILTSGNTGLMGPGEPSLYSENGTDSLIFNGWVDKTDQSTWNGSRYVYAYNIRWLNGHVPVPVAAAR